jgi:hypothetical protein
MWTTVYQPQKVTGVPKYKSWCLEMIQGSKEECTYHGEILVCKLVADEGGIYRHVAVSSTMLRETIQRTGLGTGVTYSCSSMRGVSIHFSGSDWPIRWVPDGSGDDLV